MTSTFVHVFQEGVRLVVGVSQDGPKEQWKFTWFPDLQNTQQLDELLDEYLAWVDFHADRLMEENFWDGMRFEATCGMEYELRMKQLSELAS